MQLYAGTSRDFVSDATRNAIASKLQHAFVEAYHYHPALSNISCRFPVVAWTAW